MKKRTRMQNNNAISEIVGSVILLLIAVLSFSAIYLFVFPLPGYVAESNVDIQGSVSGEFPELVHVGGETLQEYQIFINGNLYKKSENWNMGKKETLSLSFSEMDKTIEVTVVSKTDEGGSEIVFEGEFDNPFYNEKPYQGTPFIYSSLLQNTSGEDLICINGTSNDIDGDVVTSIYTWYCNDESFADLYLPFNTNSSDFTKDYMNSENKVAISNATWTDNGKVGGCYRFNTSTNGITCPLPSALNDLPNHDFSITLWINSTDINLDNNRVLEAYGDDQNYVQIFQYGSKIYASFSMDGNEYLLSSGTLNSGEWYHIGLRWDSYSNTSSLFVNGDGCDLATSNPGFTSGDKSVLSIGQKTDETNKWTGYIDEVYFYDHTVSENHIYQQYLCSRNGNSDVSVIVSEETSVNDIWSCIVIPNDGHRDGDEYEAKSLKELIELGSATNHYIKILEKING
ncbi:MAG: hypothetical protein KGY67_04610 [Candidatus Thermoplasmatota archaeon]|nr:hypothetical protein [Candidatus Thermoplasmatota archaeon]